MSALLSAQGLSLSFGRLAAIQNLDLSLAPGDRHALIGPNGAGKTTLINVLAGVLAPDQGRVCLDGRDVTRMMPDQRARHGLVRTFQVNSLFPELTALSSLVLAVAERSGASGRWWRGWQDRGSIHDEAVWWLDRSGLSKVAHVRAAHLPHGQQRLLEITLALACRPRVLLLDEPAAGLSASESRAMLDVITSLPNDIAVLLIEHDMDLVFEFAQSVSVLANGQLLARGTPEAIAKDGRVRALYLGMA